MSVADNPCYRDEPLHAVHRLIGFDEDTEPVLKKLCNFDVGESEGVDQNIVTTNGNLLNQISLGAVSLKQVLYQKVKPRFKDQVTQLLKDADIRMGLQSVYHVSGTLLKKAKFVPREQDLTMVRDLFLIGEVIGNRTPSDAKDSYSMYEAVAKEALIPYHSAHKFLLQMAMTFTNKIYKADQNYKLTKIDDPRIEQYGFDACYSFPGLLILTDMKLAYLLTKKDIERCEKILKGFGLSHFNLNTLSYLTPQERLQMKTAWDTVQKLAIKTMMKADWNLAQTVCRAFDVGYNIALAHYASDIDNEALKTQEKKFADENLTAHFSIDQLLFPVSELPMREKLEVLQFYKSFPPPDFDPYGATARQKKLYAKQNKITDNDFFVMILKYHKLLMIRAFHSRHGHCPGTVRDHDFGTNPEPYWFGSYPNVDPKDLDPSDTDLIDLKGSFMYNDHSADILDMLKDKAICPTHIRNVDTQRDLDNMSRPEKNYLLNVATRETLVDMSALRKDFDGCFSDIKCEDKAEAKKPNGRWFMEAGSDVRLVLSEYETSIANYGKYMEGFMQGKGLIEKQEMMNYVSEYTEQFADAVPLFVSFDIEKFSPRLPIQVHVELDKQWAEAFGIPEINTFSKVYTNGKIHYVKHGVHGSFDKLGNDFEGFFGRKLTFYHLAVMYAARNYLSKAGLLVGKYRFAAQIDDGLMKLNWKQEHIGRLKPELTRLWSAAGMEISWDKTFISSNFAIFLNDVRYQGRAISPGNRAFVKIRNYEEAIVPSLLNDMSTLEASIRGVYVSGGTPKTAYFVYAYLVSDLIHKWGPKNAKYDVRSLPMIFAPVCLGGLGMANSQILLGTLDFSNTVSGLANMKRMSNLNPLFVPVVNKVLNQKIREMTGDSRVANPTAFRREAKILRSDRVLLSLRKILQSSQRFPILLQLTDQDANAQLSGVIDLVGNDKRVPVELRELWYESTIRHAYDVFVSKVMTSGTAKYLLPRRSMIRAAIANTVEARSLIKEWGF